MGMFDHVVVLDEALRCPHGHLVDGFQTKSFADPAMDTYLFEGPHVYFVARREADDSGDTAAAYWLLDGGEAIFQRRHAVQVIVPPSNICFYIVCEECAPVLVRSDHGRLWGDLVEERRLWVEFRVTFGADGARRIERTSGTRDDLVGELRKDGIRVMHDDEPLAIAHREIRAARDAMPSGRAHNSR